MVTELKAEYAMNDLKGVWRAIKKTSNLPIKATNACVDLDVDETNDFFT